MSVLDIALALMGGMALIIMALIANIYLTDRSDYKKKFDDHNSRIVSLEEKDVDYRLLYREMQYLNKAMEELKGMVQR